MYVETERQWDDLVAAIKEKGRVVLTDDESTGGTPCSFKRTRYIGVFNVAHVTVDDQGLKFRFVQRLRHTGENRHPWLKCPRLNTDGPSPA
jgi:hypothetical protein